MKTKKRALPGLAIAVVLTAGPSWAWPPRLSALHQKALKHSRTPLIAFASGVTMLACGLNTGDPNMIGGAEFTIPVSGLWTLKRYFEVIVPAKLGRDPDRREPEEDDEPWRE